MDLKQRILKASELIFDKNANHDFIVGCDVENKRLRPLIEALASAVETLENINSVTKKQFEEHPMYWATMANGASGEALANLERVVAHD